jgi:hypothetical protein
MSGEWASEYLRREYIDADSGTITTRWRLDIEPDTAARARSH